MSVQREGTRHPWLLGQVEALPVKGEHKLRLHQFTIFLLLGVPLMLLFAGYHLAAGNRALGGVSLAMAVSLAAARLLLRGPRAGLAMYRINAALFGVMLLYMLAIGGPSGSKALWMFTYPLITHFLLGRREGSRWSAGLFLGASALLWGLLPGHAYAWEFALRFSLVFLIITGIAYWFEFLRQHYREGMERERRSLLQERERLHAEIATRMAAERENEILILDLREALSKVKLLTGLLPICASCKKIRDDRGLWMQMETYVSGHSGARFSHGICPECATAFRDEIGT